MNKINELFTQDLRVVNVGLELFTDAFIDVGVEYVQVDWQPPASGNQKLLDLLAMMND